MAQFRTCLDCGANLDPGEQCDCKKEKGTPPKGESAKEKINLYELYHK